MSELMQERYGATNPRSRVLLIAATTVLAVVFLGWLAWAALFHSTPAIDASVSSYDIVSTHEVRAKVHARFESDDSRGSCLLRATANDHNIVGELNVSSEQLRELKGEWIPVRTERRATTIEVVRCTERD